MYAFSKTSLNNLHNVHPQLVQIVHDTMSLQVMDFSVREGVRTIDRQTELFKSGRSKTMNSKHLIQPDGYAHAVDLYPSPIDMTAVNDVRSPKHVKEVIRFGVLTGLMLSCAKRRGIIVVNGIDWDGDGETLDHSFFDAPHFQIMLR